jgi:hypothetical protein
MNIASATAQRVQRQAILLEAAFQGDLIDLRAVADNCDLDEFCLSINPVNDPIVAAADASKSMQGPPKLLAVLLRIALQSLNGG